MARSTNNRSIITQVTSLIKLLPYDSELVEPPRKPRAIRRKATLTAERRKRTQWLAVLGGDSVIEQIEKYNPPEIADARIARKKSRALHRQLDDCGQKESTAHWKAKADRAAANWDVADGMLEVAYDPDEAERINGRRNPRQLLIDPDGHRTSSFRLAWVEYPGKPSRAQLRAMPRKCKDQFCGCRGGNNPFAAAITR